MAYNAEATGEKYREIARAMGVCGVDAMSQEEYRAAAIAAVAKLAEDVGIVCSLKGVAREEDIHQMSVDAYNDACRPGNPKDVSIEDIEAIYRSLM
jgi:lactaldehyde reductase